MQAGPSRLYRFPASRQLPMGCLFPGARRSTEVHTQFGISSGVLGRAASGYVKAHADHAPGLTRGIIENLSVTRDPAEAATGGANAILLRPIVQPSPEEFRQLPHNAVVVIRVQARFPLRP